MGLNPYSNGLPSRGFYAAHDPCAAHEVLIPILMDYPLGVGVGVFALVIGFCVLIPILMDYPLGAS